MRRVAVHSAFRNPHSALEGEVSMILVLRPDATKEQFDHIVKLIEELGFTPHISKGQHRTIIGAVGDENIPQAEETFNSLPGVEQVLRILKPFKLASREFHKADTVVQVGTTKIGGGHLGLIAGPCAIENVEFLDQIAGRVKAAGANL